MSIRETDDGRLLLHDFAGCEVEDVLAAIGLTLADLFDRPLGQHFGTSRSRIPARDVLQLVSFEIDAAMLLLTEVIENRNIDESGWQRLAQAAARIGHAKVYAHGQ